MRSAKAINGPHANDCTYRRVDLRTAAAKFSSAGKANVEGRGYGADGYGLQRQNATINAPFGQFDSLQVRCQPACV